jgi:8-oxo-dGTP pyrophosphatase MutT (NUDIX family)
MKRDRSQAMVIRDNKILLVKHRLFGREFYCLPGGGIDEGESPEEAAVRELKEEAGVDGSVLRKLTVQYKPDNKGEVHTFLLEIPEDAVATKGIDPELAPEEQSIISVAWLSLEEIGAVDQAYLWAAGLHRIEYFHERLLEMNNEII